MNVRIEITHEGETFFGEVELVGRKGAQKRFADAPTKGTTKPALVKKPSTAVEFLYRKAFFFDPHTLAETWAELQKQGFNFSRPAILMALQAADYLTMTGKRGSYRFVQKFPPTGD